MTHEQTINRLRGNFKQGDKLILDRRCLEVLKDVNLYEFMDLLRDYLKEDPVLALVGDGFVKQYKPEDDSELDALDDVPYTFMIPTQAKIDKLYEEFPYFFELTAQYAGSSALHDEHEPLSPHLCVFHVAHHLDLKDIKVEDKVFTARELIKGLMEGDTQEDPGVVEYLAIALARTSQRQQQEDSMGKHGMALQGSYDQRQVPFIYTVGLSVKYELEVVQLGNFALEALQLIVEHVAKLVKEGKIDEAAEFTLPEIFALDNGVPLRFGLRQHVAEDVVAELTQKYVRLPENIKPKRIVQVFVGDVNNKLPGEEGFDPAFVQEFILDSVTASVTTAPADASIKPTLH